MSLREVGWGLFLAGLPFAHFLLPHTIQQWQTQTLWAQAWLVALFGFSLGQTKSTLGNLPLGCWLVWIGLSVMWTWVSYLHKDAGHPVGLLPPFLHFLCVVIFYLAATTYWTPELLSRLLTWLAYAGLILVCYGFLQLIHFDQFYKTIDSSPDLLGRDVVLGTMGNPTHFGNHLALLLPIFLWQPQWPWKIVAVLATVLMIFTKSTSAVICGWAVWMLWGFFETKWLGWTIGATGLAVGGAVFLANRDWFNLSGRWEAWQAFWQHYLAGDHKHQITGAGLGRVMLDSSQNYPGWPSAGSEKWRHIHNGFFQILIEQGVIGLGVVLWGVVHAIHRWWRLPRTPMAKTLAGIGVAFLMLNQVNFIDHFWVLASLGLVAYCGVYVLSHAEVA